MYELDKNLFGQKIKLYRTSRNIALETLGQMINKTKATISKYESGEIIPDIFTSLEICNALNISLPQIFSTAQTITNNSTFNPFSCNTIYMYYYTENHLITSIIEFIENDNNIAVKYFNGVKDMKNMQIAVYTYMREF